MLTNWTTPHSESKLETYVIFAATYPQNIKISFPETVQFFKSQIKEQRKAFEETDGRMRLQKVKRWSEWPIAIWWRNLQQRPRPAHRQCPLLRQLKQQVTTTQGLVTFWCVTEALSILRSNRLFKWSVGEANVSRNVPGWKFQYCFREIDAEFWSPQSHQQLCLFDFHRAVHRNIFLW